MTQLSDILLDLVSFAVPLQIELVRVTGTDTKTTFEAIDDPNNPRLSMRAETREPFKEFEGRFAMPTLSKLKGGLEYCQFYTAGEKDMFEVELTRTEKEGEKVPLSIKINKGRAKGEYPLMVNNLPKQLQAKEGALKWDAAVTQPAKSKITEFVKATGATTSKNFTFKTDDDQNLIALLGDSDGTTETVEHPFASGIKNKINPVHMWETSKFLNVMNLADKANTEVKVSNQGVILIKVGNMLMDYEFMLPGFKG